MKQIGSLITTEQRAPSSKTGMLVGEPGSEMLVASPQIAAWLARREPKEVDKAAVSRASQLNVGLAVRLQTRFPKDGPAYDVVVGCEVYGDGDLATVAAELRKFITPAPQGDIEGWLAELSVITARKPGDDFEEALRLEAYARRLSEYPADVVRYATLECPWKFWPAWIELKAVCDAKVARRRSMLRAIEARL